jgi:hypothetical protein
MPRVVRPYVKQAPTQCLGGTCSLLLLGDFCGGSSLPDCLKRSELTIDLARLLTEDRSMSASDSVTVPAVTSGPVILRKPNVRRFEVTAETAIPAIGTKNVRPFLSYYLLWGAQKKLESLSAKYSNIASSKNQTKKGLCANYPHSLNVRSEFLFNA